MRILASLFFLILLSGCALSVDEVPISYTPSVASTVLPGASNVTIVVLGQDDRTAHADRIGVKKNGYGVEMAPIRASNDIVELIRSGVEQQLRAEGFKIGEGGLTITVSVLNFYNDFSPGIFSSDANANVSFSIAVSRPDGSNVYARTYAGYGINPNIQIMSGANAKVALEAALNMAMKKFDSDPRLLKALTSLSRVEGAAPQS